MLSFLEKVEIRSNLKNQGELGSKTTGAVVSWKRSFSLILDGCGTSFHDALTGERNWNGMFKVGAISFFSVGDGKSRYFIYRMNQHYLKGDLRYSKIMGVVRSLIGRHGRKEVSGSWDLRVLQNFSWI